MTKEEMNLFEIGTGNGLSSPMPPVNSTAQYYLQVPVIAIFTKMDALDERAFNQLLNDGSSFREAKSKAPSVATDIFERDYLQPLENVTYKPARNVQLRGMLFLVNDTGDSLNHSQLRHAQERYGLRYADR